MIVAFALLLKLLSGSYQSESKNILHNRPSIEFYKGNSEQFRILNTNYMNDTLIILRDFENCLKKYCLPVYEKLKGGLNPLTIDQMLKEANISDLKLRELYSWKNGIEHDSTKFVGEFDFCSHGKMLPLDAALIHYKTYASNNNWLIKYFPLFTTNTGDFLLYDIDVNSKTYGMLLIYSPSLFIVDPQPIYDNLDLFIETIILCYEQGVYKFNKTTNTIEIEYDKEFEISRTQNKHSIYWQE